MQGQTNHIHYQTASSSIRVFAWLVDMVLLFLGTVVVSVVVDLAGGAFTGQPYVVPSFLPIILALSMVYAVPLWRLRGATLGCSLFGIYVYRATAPVPLDWRRAALRWFGPFGWMIFAVASLHNGFWVNVMLLTLLIVAISAGTDVQRRFQHDRLIGSVVVQRIRE
jgi:hypothetical protein